MATKRKAISRTVEQSVLLKSKRRCALCFHFDTDFSEKKGQIAHIDRKADNSAEDNLVWLCLNHHDVYDSITSQSKGIQIGELTDAKKRLETFMAEHQSEFPLMSSVKERYPFVPSAQGVSLKVFEIRMPVYRAFRDFVSHVVQEGKVGNKELFEYAEKIHDALFLFDEHLDQYLQEVYKKAVQLRGLGSRMDRPDRFDNAQWSDIVSKETELILWFAEQFEQGRIRFNNYLNISGHQPTSDNSA